MYYLLILLIIKQLSKGVYFINYIFGLSNLIIYIKIYNIVNYIV